MKNCDVFLLFFAQNIDCGYTLERLNEAVLTSTHNLCFREKIRKNVYPCKHQFSYIKVGYKGVYITWTCLHDDYTFWIWIMRTIKVLIRLHGKAAWKRRLIYTFVLLINPKPTFCICNNKGPDQLHGNRTTDQPPSFIST